MMAVTPPRSCPGRRGFLTSPAGARRGPSSEGDYTVKAGKTIIGALAAAVLLSTGVQPGHAVDANKKYKLRGLGAYTCSKYLEERRADLKGTMRYADWLTGYLTAYNYFQPNTFDIAPNHDANGLLTYLDLYCSKNQKQLVGQAASAFVKAVYDKRRVSE